MNVTPISSKKARHSDAGSNDSSPFRLVRRLDAPVWIFDIDAARIVFANDSACKLWGAESEAALCARDMTKDMSSTVAKRLKQYQSDFAESDATFTELWTLYPNGAPKSMMVIFKGHVLADGRMAMLCEAVAETKDQPQNLRSAEALLHTDVMITLLQIDGPPLYHNPAARNAFADAQDALSDIIVDPADYFAFMTQIDMLGEHRCIVKVRTTFGERWFDLSAKKCLDAVTGYPAILLTAIDVSDLKEARDTARYLADRDQLTDLYNRAFLKSELAKLAHEPSDNDLAIIFFDVDRFKLINDRYGHATGDVVLQQIALRVRQNLSLNDVAVRLGGDEFVILFKEACDNEVLAERIESLKQFIMQPIVHNDNTIDLSVSIGVATFSSKAANFTRVLREADVALYASKQGGRNRTTFFCDNMGEAVRARDQLERELKQAITDQEFTLHYQPRLDLKSGRVIALEGLVRWNHPIRGVVMPDDFIPVCEETGIIEDLGRMVLELGCAQVIEWHRRGFDVTVSINVSPRQFGDEGLMVVLRELSDLPGFPVGKVELEITENVLFGDHQLIAEKLRLITEMGYQVAIDDFGTGYSNLSYISRFPLTCLKIDRSFIDQLPDSGPIIRLIITLGQQIGATIVSEGVETKDQLDFLTNCDCEQAQGYLIARPMPPDDIPTYLETMNASGVS